MCRKCEPILGCKTKKHAEEECPLFQASYCALCGTRGHFTKTCDKKPKMVSDSVTAIESVKSPLEKGVYIMADEKEGYEEYLKLYGIEPTSRKDRNKTLVTNHLASRGLKLTGFPLKPKTPAAGEFHPAY